MTDNELEGYDILALVRENRRLKERVTALEAHASKVYLHELYTSPPGLVATNGTKHIMLVPFFPHANIRVAAIFGAGCKSTESGVSGFAVALYKGIDQIPKRNYTLSGDTITPSNQVKFSRMLPHAVTTQSSAAVSRLAFQLPRDVELKAGGVYGVAYQVEGINCCFMGGLTDASYATAFDCGDYEFGAFPSTLVGIGGSIVPASFVLRSLIGLRNTGR